MPLNIDIQDPLLSVGEILAKPFQVHKTGYAVMWMPEHPCAWKSGIVRRSHAVLWASGRPVGPGQIAHHLDHNKLNDDPSNLFVMGHGTHTAMHKTGSIGPMRGKTHTAETRAKIAAATMGNQRALGHRHTPESKTLMSQNRSGILHSAEARAKMSASARARGFAGDDSTREKLTQAARRRWVGHTTNPMSCSICGLSGRKKSSHHLPNHGAAPSTASDTTKTSTTAETKRKAAPRGSDLGE
jgi:hypothetical protein